MTNIISIKGFLKRLKESAKSAVRDDSGAQMTEYVIIILLIIIVGGLFLTLMTGSLNEIWGLAIDRIKSVFSL